ncbi:MAG: SDR family oxidoreductase [Acidobacteria bacterium]|nr:SDR family oxidoreductase [Acidobacteriota bacterium]MBI3425260.1 SDR family oxidoreductase [Acidobacteriota bacterium]
MNLKDKVAVVTGGANGIGAALCRRFAQEGARVVVADLEAEKAQTLAAEIGALAVGTDVGKESDLINLVQQANAAYGPIDLFCSNAGIGGPPGGIEASNEAWQQIWEINLMAHVYAARAVLPQMLERGAGYLLNTASAAGLLSQIGAAPYAVTKHAAVSFAEWLAITYGDRGIKVSCLCPQGVRTRMLEGDEFHGITNFLRESAIEPAALAEVVVQGLASEQFLILPHPEVAEYIKRKAGDYDRWLRGMRKLQANLS